MISLMGLNLVLCSNVNLLIDKLDVNDFLVCDSCLLVIGLSEFDCIVVCFFCGVC